LGILIQKPALPPTPAPIQKHQADGKPIKPWTNPRWLAQRSLLRKRSERNLLHDFVYRLAFPQSGKHRGAKPSVVLR
jgi:hypothetical protein